MFLVGAAPVWLLVLAIFAWLRRQEPEAKIGVATGVTLFRGILLGALAGCIPLSPRGWVAWAPGILYTTAALADLVDGYLARRLGEVSILGGRLDVALDALGLLVAPLAAVVLGRLPPWYLFLGATYYLFHATLWLRRRRGLPLYEDRLRPTPHARMFAGYQMGLVATALFPVLGPPGTFITATLFMVPTLVLFGREWLLVTGRVRADAGRGALAAARFALAAALPAVRVGVAVSLMVLVVQQQLPLIAVAVGPLLAAGVLTRTMAFATAILVCRALPHGAAFPLVVYLGTMLLLMAGGGRSVLWNPEDRWLFAKAGTQPDRVMP